MVQRYDLCESRLYAVLLFRSQEDTEIALTVNANQLRKFLQVGSNDDVTEMALVSMPMLKSVTYNKRNVLTRFEFLDNHGCGQAAGVQKEQREESAV